VRQIALTRVGFRAHTLKHSYGVDIGQRRAQSGQRHAAARGPAGVRVHLPTVSLAAAGREGSDAGPSPALFSAATRNSYVAPAVSPVTVYDVLSTVSFNRPVNLLKPKGPIGHLKKVKFSHTRYRALGPELIPVYRQSARR